MTQPFLLARPESWSRRSARGERRFLVDNVTWDQYCALRKSLDDQPGVRITYLEGRLELLSPSSEHERIKKTLARLIEAFAEERNLPLNGFGQTTCRKKTKKRGLEPDECYFLGRQKRYPDLALEVVITSGMIDRLEVYAGLRVAEVWVRRRGKLSIHHRKGRGYRLRPRSALLPGLNPALLERFVRRSDQTAAVRAFRKALRRG